MGERKQFGQALSEFQALRFRIADYATEIEAARLADTGEEVALCGWVWRRRDHGGVTFVDMDEGRPGLCGGGPASPGHDS